MPFFAYFMFFSPPFFLKMASQKCFKKKLTDGTPSVIISYPYYTNDKSKIVFGYDYPPAYLVEQKQSFTVFTVVGSSFSQMWVTLFLCVIWSLISGVFMWLMVSKYLGFVYLMCFLFSVRHAGNAMFGLTILRD